jgi:hypothetical protein
MNRNMSGWSILLMQCAMCLAVARAISAGEPPAKPVDPAMEKVCTEFAKKIEATINASDPGPFNRAVDNNAIADAALQGFDVPDQLKTMVRVQFIGVNLGTTLVTECIRKGGSYKFMRLRVVDGEPRALFRLLPGPTMRCASPAGKRANRRWWISIPPTRGSGLPARFAVPCCILSRWPARRTKAS